MQYKSHRLTLNNLCQGLHANIVKSGASFWEIFKKSRAINVVIALVVLEKFI